jgi:hypothetical protein
MVGIKFEVRNDGDTVTGPWSFTASLPSLSTPVYNSNTQISLRPGDSIIFTLGFSNLTGQNQSLITVNVDPANQVRESVETNNVLTAPISVTGYNPNYYNNNYYNNNYPYNYNYQNNGCYVNGYFTYNCLNNYPYNYNYNNYNNYGGLSVSCYADPGNPQTGDRVRWYANVYGGDGNYDYDWSGTNSLNSSTQNPSKTYSSRGTKNATVTVEDGNGDTATASCSVYVN